MVAQPARMSRLIVEQEQRLPGAAFDDVQLDTSGLDQLFSPRHGTCCHDVAPTFHLCGKGFSPRKGRKSQTMRQVDGRHPSMDIPRMSKALAFCYDALLDGRSISYGSEAASPSGGGEQMRPATHGGAAGSVYQAARTVRASLEGNGLFCRTLLVL